MLSLTVLGLILCTWNQEEIQAMESGGDSGQRDVARTMQNGEDKLDTAIEQDRKIPYLDEDSDSCYHFGGCDVAGSALEPSLPLAASIAAVSAAHCWPFVSDSLKQEDRC